MTLSVAMCTYNGAKYVREQLESILQQELPVDEIVVCDDGSKDETLAIVRAVADQYPEVHWNIQQNCPGLGVLKNFEKALSLCGGDIIFLSDQDDIWVPVKTRKLVDYLQLHPEVNLAFTDAELIDEEGRKRTDKTLFDACGFRPLEKAWNEGLQFEIENVIQRLLGSTFAMRREFVRSCLPFNPEVHNFHDGQLAFYSVVRGCNGYLNECLLRYRIHGDNVVGVGGLNNWVFRGVERPNEFKMLVEPQPVNPFFLLPQADGIRERVDFYRYRYANYSTVVGKFKLLFRLASYRKYYKSYWTRFFRNDFLYGIASRLRLRNCIKSADFS